MDCCLIISRFNEDISWLENHKDFKVIIYNKGKELKRQRADFVRFIDEKDKRRGTNFLETFPQLKESYNASKSNTSL